MWRRRPTEELLKRTFAEQHSDNFHFSAEAKLLMQAALEEFCRSECARADFTRRMVAKCKRVSPRHLMRPEEEDPAERKLMRPEPKHARKPAAAAKRRRVDDEEEEASSEDDPVDDDGEGEGDTAATA